MISIEECDSLNDYYYVINDDAEIGSSAMENTTLFRTQLSYNRRFGAELISVAVPIGGVNVDIIIPLNLINELVNVINNEKKQNSGRIKFE